MRMVTMILVAAVLGCACLFVFVGCKNKSVEHSHQVEKPKIIEISDIQKFSFSMGGFVKVDVLGFTVERIGDHSDVSLKGYRVPKEFVYTDEQGMLEQIKALLEANDVGSWNGFNGAPPKSDDVRDGKSFELNIKFTNGEKLHATGWCVFPNNYREVEEGLWKIAQPAIDAFRDHQKQ